MPRTAAKITQADIARVLRAVEQTGVSMEVIIGKDGSIRIVPYDGGEVKQKSVKLDIAHEIRL